MEEPIFEVTPRKYTGESTILSMRIPKQMVKDIDAAATKAVRTRNEFLMMCLEFALDHLEIKEKNEKGG